MMRRPASSLRAARAALPILFFSLCALSFAACDNGTPPGGDGGACSDECATIGASRCDGTVVQACGIGPAGCAIWRSGIDCAASGTVCDDSAEPAVCSAGAGTCTDGARNQDETDVDCGGSRCSGCANGQGCSVASDCMSNNCDTGSNTCVPSGAATCTDGVRNQDETDVDCGGSVCDGCGVGRGCAAGADCLSGMCDGTTCQALPGTCTDGAQNQDESDVDCGGTACPSCVVGQRCEEARDCSSGRCESRVCASAPASCTDGVRNGDESDVDCGGATCPACSDGDGCRLPSDCAGGFCVLGACQSAGDCTDGVQNSDETDVDCGGTSCGPCPNGRGCVNGTDCRSGVCDTGGADLCINPGGPTCTDGMQNRDESDVDCGGAFCPACALGEACTGASDCASGACDLLDTRTCVSRTDPRYLVDEDFETGDFSRFPYSFDGTGGAEPHPFVIETDAANCHMGMHCMRSSRFHELGETRSISVALSVRNDTNVTFWLKTNLEPDEHFFRFYVDGAMMFERTGQHDWELVTVPVPATGAGGPDRVLTWEYSRSTFVSPDHMPWYEVWVDDIDMPDWNTEPSVPELIRPTNGQLTTDTTPSFRWESFDPDFDTITYEMQYDTAPSFPLPVATGETNNVMFTPPAPLADGVYYWRVRAKDNSNFRWSAWSPTYAVEVNSGYEYGSVWRQSVRAQFEMNTNGGLVINDENVAAGTVAYDNTQSGSIAHNGGTRSFNYSMLPGVGAGMVNGTITITASGDFNSTTESATVRIDGTVVGTYNPTTCGGTTNFNVTDIGRFVNDGSATISFQTSTSVDLGGCSGTTETVSARLRYNAALPGEMTSVPIRFSTFEGRTLWEKVQIVGTGGITVQVLDESAALIPDSILPGNSVGLSDRTIRLWDLDPMAYPVIRLRVTMSGGAVMDEWRVVGNDFHEWLFSTDGDSEGWIAADRMGTPAVSTAAGVLRFTSTLDGTDPHIEYAMPQPVAANRFTTAVVRLRTSTTFFNDDVSFWWASNFGMFDVRRSFTSAGEFLVELQDVEIDLTQAPTPPNEAWRGNIEAIRIDPLDHFVDAAGMPADGWFEIDRIILR